MSRMRTHRHALLQQLRCLEAVYALQQDRLPAQQLVDEIDRQAHALLRLDSEPTGPSPDIAAASSTAYLNEKPLAGLRALIRAHSRFEAIKELRPPPNTPSATNLPSLPSMHSAGEVSAWLQRMIQWSAATRRPVSCCLAYPSATSTASAAHEWCFAVLHLPCPLAFDNTSQTATGVFPVMYLSSFKLDALHEGAESHAGMRGGPQQDHGQHVRPLATREERYGENRRLHILHFVTMQMHSHINRPRDRNRDDKMIS